MTITKASNLLLFLGLLLLTFKLSAQTESCGFDSHLERLLKKDKSFTQKFKQQNKGWKNIKKQFLPNNRQHLHENDTIPIVVHILHLGESIGEGTNISDAQIYSAINNLNDAYSASGRYSESIDVGLRFALARYDTLCNPFSGIIRVDASKKYNYEEDGITRENEVSLKCINKFPSNKYYNIWIVSEIDGKNNILGHAYLPEADKSLDGAVILYNAFGYDPNGQLGYNLRPNNKHNVTAVHELGHAFNLFHTFQGDNENNNCPADTICGDNSDCCDDTDPHKQNFPNFGCISDSINECTNRLFGNLPKNFMAYSQDSCQILFTPDQVARMKAALSGPRASLVNSSGLLGLKESFSPPNLANCQPTTINLEESQQSNGGLTNLTISSEVRQTGTTTEDEFCYGEKGYLDFTDDCSTTFFLEEGRTYDFSVTTHYNNHAVKAWIDYNNNDDYEENELIFDVNTNGLINGGTDQASGTFSIIPSAVKNTYLKLRVLCDDEISGPCDSLSFGQCENYPIYIQSIRPECPDSSVISGSTIINKGESAKIKVDIKGGLSPYTIILNDGTNDTIIENYISENNIVVSPTIHTTYTIASIKDANDCEESINVGQVIITVNDSPHCAISDSVTLIAIYRATNGGNWKSNTNWLSDTLPISQWQGVTTNTEGCVTKLDLYDNNLTGALPREIGNLSQLEELSLHKNKLTSQIPPEFIKLTALKVLFLSDNQLDGIIPIELTHLDKLKTLALGENQLSGNIPIEIGNLKNLTRLDLNDNDLKDTIPHELWTLTKLKKLYLQKNGLIDTIANTIGQLINLQHINLSNNQLSGNIPNEIGNLINLKELNFDSNLLSGKIPLSIGNLINLEYLHLSNNNIENEIPATIGDLSSLKFLYLQDNQFLDTLPNALHKLSNLERLYLQNNELSGCFPESYRPAFCGIKYDFSNNSNLANEGNFEAFCIDDAKRCPSESCPSTSIISGDTTIHQGSYANISVKIIDGISPYTLVYSNGVTNFTQENYFSESNITVNPTFTTTYSILSVTDANECAGTDNIGQATITIEDVPSCIDSDSTSLVAIYNATNGTNWTNQWELNQPMRTWYGVTTNTEGCVAELDLYNNNLKGALPKEIGNLSQLEELSLHGNKLTGQIPPEFINLTALKVLLLSDNQLDGVIPTELTHLNKLTRLSLSKNQLSGNIPTEIGNLENLTWLDLNDNDLKDTIPHRLWALTKLRRLYLQENELIDTIPNTIGQLINLQEINLGDNQFSGNIPNEIGNLVKLKKLNLNSNLLSGKIPLSIENLVKLEYLFLSNNNITDTIPAIIGNLSSLQSLHLQDNQLSGSLPESLVKLTNLEQLYLQNNQLSGCFPNSYRAAFCSISSDFSGNINLSNEGEFEVFCQKGVGGCPSPVWPGDFNNDGGVNIVDVLFYMKIRNGKKGPRRDSTICTWEMQLAENWLEALGNINNKHQDGNGDGIIDSLDFETIMKNYNKTRPMEFNSQAPTKFTFKFKKINNPNSDTLYFDLYLEKTTNTFAKIHGIAGSIKYGENLGKISDGKEIHFTDALSPDLFTTINNAKNSLDFASVKLNNFDFSNNPIAKCFVLKKNIETTNSNQFDLSIRNSRIIITESAGTDKDTIFENTRNITVSSYYSKDIANDEFEIYANITHKDCNTLGSISLTKSNGEPPSNLKWKTGENTPTISALDSGVYVVAVTFENDSVINYSFNIEDLSLNCSPVLLATFNNLDTVCNGDSTNISIAVSGGTSPYKIAYHDGQKDSILLGYISGNPISVNIDSTKKYTINAVIDKNGHVGTGYTSSLTVNVNPPMEVVLQGSTTIKRGQTAAIAIKITGGTGPYTLTYTNGSKEVTKTNYVSDTEIPVSPLETTTYAIISVIDANNCIEINDSAPIVITVTSSNCPIDIDLSNSNCASDSHLIQAQQTVTSNCLINADLDVVYMAGESINLKPGFEVTTGGQFTAKIEACSNEESIDTIDSSNYPRARFATAPSPKPMNNDLSLGIFPNPMKTAATIIYNLPDDARVNLNILDLQGRHVQNLVNQQNQAKGKHKLEWNRGEIPKGMYLLHLQTETAIQTIKIIILD